VRPTEIYNLAAMSFVPTSWQQPVLTAEFDAIGVTRMLEATRLVAPEARFYQASSSEMFGKVRETPQRETTPFHPRSPYGVAKVYGHHITVNRESYDLSPARASCSTTESPRRGRGSSPARCPRASPASRLGQATELTIGNLTRAATRLRGDFVDAMWRSSSPRPTTTVATGGHSVRELIETPSPWSGSTGGTCGRIPRCSGPPRSALIGDAAKARAELEFRSASPNRRDMVRADLDRLRERRGGLAPPAGTPAGRALRVLVTGARARGPHSCASGATRCTAWRDVRRRATSVRHSSSMRQTFATPPASHA
jgi:GDPmannose 4,6-dehydratase